MAKSTKVSSLKNQWLWDPPPGHSALISCAPPFSTSPEGGGEEEAASGNDRPGEASHRSPREPKETSRMQPARKTGLRKAELALLTNCMSVMCLWIQLV